MKRRTILDRVVNMSFGETKHCNKCNTTKPRSTDNFSFDITRKDGLAHWCRPCANLYAKIKAYRFTPSENYWNEKRRAYCKERLAFWTNELNKARNQAD